MLRLLPLAAVGAILQASSVLAQTTCSLGQKCPEDLPCCSQYGQCGVGAFCLGGCDPRMSFTLDSCVPAPVCKSKKFAMNGMDGVVDIGEYLGDSSTADWVSTGYPAPHGGNLLLTMPPRSAGTVLASTTYMWYGNVKARLKTSVGAGVVTAFILLSDVKDEIDFEFVGVDLGTAQTNYYFQGIPDYANSGNISGVSNTYDNFHEYEIRWTPDEIKWLVDGKEGRTKKRSETWNDTSNQWAYPQTPARVQLSIWPGGAPSNAEGTITWAGGPIDWDSDYIKRNKYYFATFGEIEISCYDADSPPGTNKKKSYIFNDARATNDTVEDTDRPTVLKSFSGTGRDMEAGFDPNDSQNSVPGGSSTGPGQNPGGNGGAGNDCSAKSFSQNCGQNDNNNGAGPMLRQNMLGASSLAVVIAVTALLWL